MKDSKSYTESISFVVLLQTFYCQSFYSNSKNFFLGFPLANVDLNIVPISL